MMADAGSDAKDLDAEAALAAMQSVKATAADDQTIAELTRNLRSMRKISDVELSQTQSESRREQQTRCLKESLQAAITLEFATIPPYLCSLWSIKDELHPVAKSIREVVQEEMLHMALACNMLSSLGVSPRISAPSYPGGLPGGVHKGLEVELAGLSKKALLDFLWIERPVAGLPIEHPYAKGREGDYQKFQEVEASLQAASDTTIGEFYEEIREGFRRYIADEHTPDLTPDHQLTGPLAYAVIRDMDSVNYAIDLIQHQGEGSSNDPREINGDLSHYYRFLEAYNEQKYEWDEERGVLVGVGELPFPDVYPMAPIPAGGYNLDAVPGDVAHHLGEFDRTYSMLLQQLDSAWSTTGSQSSLVCAYSTMFDLGNHARALMQIRTPFGGGASYGPCFRVVPV